MYSNHTAHERSRDTLRIFCGTWNMAQNPPNNDIDEWLLPDAFTGANSADILAVGLQESEYPIAQLDTDSVDKDLQIRLETALNRSKRGAPWNYQCVAFSNLMQVI